MLTDTATLARASQVMMLENEPPGQDAAESPQGHFRIH